MIKTLEDARMYLIDNTKNKWEWRCWDLENVIDIKGFQICNTWTIDGNSTNFENVIKVLYKNRKTINTNIREIRAWIRG